MSKLQQQPATTSERFLYLDLHACLLCSHMHSTICSKNFTCMFSSDELLRRSQRGGGNGGGVTAPKFCGFRLDFSQMFWDGGAFHVSCAVQHQSENPSCPILRTLESLSKPVPNARCNRRASSSPQPPRAKQSSVQAMVEDCSGFWMGLPFDFWKPKIWYVSPPPLFGPYVYPPPPNRASSTRERSFQPSPPTKLPATPYVFTPPRKCIFLHFQRCMLCPFLAFPPHVTGLSFLSLFFCFCHGKPPKLPRIFFPYRTHKDLGKN